MLPPFIIDQIRRREEEERRRHEAPVVELPVPQSPGSRDQRPRREDDEPQRGVVIIDVA